MFTFIKPDTNIDFMGKRYFFLAISFLLIATSVYFLSTKGLNYGIDFTGGVEVRVKASSDIKIENIREILKKADLKDISVQDFGKNNSYLVKVSATDKDLNPLVSRIQAAFTKSFDKKVEILKVDVVGPRVGEELRLGGIYSCMHY